jgi:hypothetical protein
MAQTVLLEAQAFDINRAEFMAHLQVVHKRLK